MPTVFSNFFTTAAGCGTYPRFRGRVWSPTLEARGGRSQIFGRPLVGLSLDVSNDSRRRVNCKKKLRNNAK